MSDVLMCGIGLYDDMDGPWFVAEYRYSEYNTVMKLISPSGKITTLEYLMEAVIRNTSLIKLILGGAAIFAQQNINHQNEIIGITDNNPFVSVSLRVIVILYVIFAIQNMAEDLSPCASIIDNLAWSPSFEPVIMAASIKPIWPIDEYAINDFISDWRIQIIEVTTPPTKAIAIIGDANNLFM